MKIVGKKSKIKFLCMRGSKAMFFGRNSIFNNTSNNLKKDNNI